MAKRTELYLKKESLKWALAHIEQFGDTDIFPEPFEFAAIRADWGELLPQLEEIDVSRHQVGENRRALTPKSRYGFRLATQLQPIDAILFAALVYEVAAEFERSRVPVARMSVMSHRVRRTPEGDLYDPTYNFEAFKAELRRRCSSHSGGWVVATDIADFYSRIYHHPLENALSSSAPTSAGHVGAIMNLLSQWTFSVSSGIPVGPSATRILAEVAINDVDRALTTEGIDFCRFSDDFRLFAPTEREAFKALATLADYLQENHGLTLSERKTDVLPVDRFTARHLDGTRPNDSTRLADHIGRLLEEHGLKDDRYALASREDLPEELIDELDELDLNRILVDQLDSSRMFDTFAVSIALRRLAQLEDPSLVDTVTDHLDYLTPVLPQVVSFLQKATPAVRREEVGARLVGVMQEGLSSHQEYQRTWLLSLFASDSTWGNQDGLIRLLPEVRDDVSRPILLQALGIAGHHQWFRNNRRRVQSMGGWERRAFIVGASCMSADEYRAWLRTTVPRLDLLDSIVGRQQQRALSSTSLKRPAI